MSRTSRAIGLGALLVGLGSPLDARGQVCEPVAPGDRVELDVEAHFLNRLWARKDFLVALFTSTVPERGYFQTVRGDSLWISGYRQAGDGEGVHSGNSDGFPVAEVHTIRKNCRGDPVWDGALMGAVRGASLAFTIDLMALVATPFGVRPFPIARGVPEMYLIPTAIGAVVLGVLDWVAPDWIEVDMPEPEGHRTLSFGLSIPLH